MKEAIKFEISDYSELDTIAELIIDIETDTFELIIANKVIMSGMWSGKLQKVFQRALEIWKVEKDGKKSV